LQRFVCGRCVAGFTGNKHCSTYLAQAIDALQSVANCGGSCDIIMSSRNFNECMWQQVPEFADLVLASTVGAVTPLIFLPHMQSTLYDACNAIKGLKSPKTSTRRVLNAEFVAAFVGALVSETLSVWRVYPSFRGGDAQRFRDARRGGSAAVQSHPARGRTGGERPNIA
jgi:hypothetical protein